MFRVSVGCAGYWVASRRDEVEKGKKHIVLGRVQLNGKDGKMRDVRDRNDVLNRGESRFIEVKNTHFSPNRPVFAPLSVFLNTP